MVLPHVTSRAWADDEYGNYSDNTGLVTQFSTAVWERLTNDTGSNSDLITNDPSLTGSGVANAVVHFTVDGSPISDTAVADGSGMWDFTPIGLGQGVHTIVASETDTAGNTRTDSLTFTLDTIAPSSAITSETLNKSGSSLILTGSAEVGSTVKIYDGSTLLGTTTTGSNDTWTFATQKVSNAVHLYTADLMRQTLLAMSDTAATRQFLAVQKLIPSSAHRATTSSSAMGVTTRSQAVAARNC